MWGAGVICDRFVALFSRVWVAAACLGLANDGALGQAALGIDTRIAAPATRKPPASGRKALPEPLPEDGEDALAAEPPPLAEGDEDADGEGAMRTSYTSPEAAAPDADRVGEHRLDGVVLEDSPVTVLDGIADLGVDPRSAQDIAAFQIPPYGFDPYMFRIEPEPLRDRRPAELFHLEPYDPIGLRMGGFVIFPELEIGALATNNVFRSNLRQGDAAGDVRANVRAVTNWPVHALEFRALGAASFYAGHPSEDDRAYALDARGRLDISSRSNIEGLISHQREKDVRSALNFPVAAAERGDLEVDRAAITFNHRFNRLAFQLRGAIRDFDFAPVPSIGGEVINNDARDFTEREAAFRTTWDFGRGLGVFVETALADRDYHTPPADGSLRSSVGEAYRAGVSFSPLGSSVRGEISAGWGRQRPDVADLPQLDGLLIDANLAWRASALTSFLFTARSTFADSTVPASSGGLARQFGLQVRHAFYRHLIGTAGVLYTSTPYDGVDLTERELIGELGLDYYVGRDAILFGRYQHTVYDTSVPSSDYSADVLRAGLRLRY